MSILSSLKVIARPKIEPKPPILGKRLKLIEKLDEQQAMAQAMLDGQAYEAYKDKKVKDPETGERKTVRTRKAVRPWYFDDNEHYYFEIKVGLKTLELEKGKAAIDVGKKEDLPTVISTIIKAVESGELDAQILQLSPAKPPKPPKAKTTDKK
ncbi:MAG: hypothetical protein CL577_09305 [Alteromonadaceae bacterium]|jgi:hypothetical protein|uniref:Uncharacterized protein n=3 Tax=Gammaproteobacteria TaxID=1236 RepID=A0ABS8C6F7_9ALTE|nr:MULTISPECIES: DUF6641 family protein [Gammaproteobacteria]MBJ92775.1 hypothetical protein [Alteromonadaceae bacterium]MCB5214314.1 hypothetical protein [Rheinheimera aquimaris]MCB5227715.1 hypothetical protein [Alishewanella maricola]MCD1600225.1 hypothetical protein [Rheinheimera aquimaris]|tara:strand:+ start:10904 stop:11362 length:459 start_codon:yes stop_codon:yes gene_type:complete